MACRGVHFSLDERIASALQATGDEQERLQYIQEQIEEDYFRNHPEWLAETDKSWDWIHRVLTDGELDWNNGTYPLNHVVMGGESLYSESDYIISLKTPKPVADAAIELRNITQENFREKFFQLDEFDIEHSYEEGFEYTWQWFQSLRSSGCEQRPKDDSCCSVSHRNCRRSRRGGCELIHPPGERVGVFEQGNLLPGRHGPARAGAGDQCETDAAAFSPTRRFS